MFLSDFPFKKLLEAFIAVHTVDMYLIPVIPCYPFPNMSSSYDTFSFFVHVSILSLKLKKKILLIEIDTGKKLLHPLS